MVLRHARRGGVPSRIGSGRAMMGAWKDSDDSHREYTREDLRQRRTTKGIVIPGEGVIVTARK
ncbi:MAG: hypothetical protein E6K19_03465 [Methanobacteriota archaeon]|nr:MAG: hypothetical protein E6K19_03465 [Euryarchaeota archaeon]